MVISYNNKNNIHEKEEHAGFDYSQCGSLPTPFHCMNTLDSFVHGNYSRSYKADQTSHFYDLTEFFEMMHIRLQVFSATLQGKNIERYMAKISITKIISELYKYVCVFWR